MRHLVLPLAAILAAGPLASPLAWAARPRPKASAVDPTTPGALVVSSVNDGATLAVDGRVVGTLPLGDSLLLAPGPHTLRLSLRGHQTFEGPVAIKPGETLDLELDLIPFAGLVRVTSTPAGATVSVDGALEGVTPLDTDIPAGERTLLVRLPDHADEVRTVSLAPTQTYVFDFALRALPKAPAPSSRPEFHATWWFWTLVGVAGAGAATAAALSAGSGDGPTVRPDLTLRIP